MKGHVFKEDCDVLYGFAAQRPLGCGKLKGVGDAVGEVGRSQRSRSIFRFTSGSF